MAHLVVHLLGPLEIKLNGEPVSGLESDKVRALLVFLVVARAGPHRREKLAAMLWPDYPESSARANLRRALANLRKALGDCEAVQPFLLVTRQTIQFNPDSDAWVDLSDLTGLLNSGLRPALDPSRNAAADSQTVRQLEDAVKLYRGEFLEGFSLTDSPPFEEWALLEQEQLHRQIMDALCHLGSWYEGRGEWEQALTHAWRQVELDPWRESGHRQVMRLLARSGQRGAALLQYRACCQVLEQELGVRPEEETVQLYEQIRNGTLEPPVVMPNMPREPAVAPRLPAFLAKAGKERQVSPVFVGREQELEHLDGLLEKAVGGQGQIVFVTGGPGRGKTALLVEFARRAMDSHSDLLAAAGQCNAYVGVGDPYLPFRDVLALLTGDVEAQWKAGSIGLDQALRLWNALPLTVQILLQRGSQVIPTLLSGTALLSRAATTVPSDTPWLCRLKERVEHQDNQAAGSEQTRLFQQVADVLYDLAEVHPLLLILDDLQWIDTSSACLLFHLGRRLGGSRILIAGAYRPEELVPGGLADPPARSVAGQRQRHPLEKVLNEFKRRFGDIWIDLAAISEPEARRFVDALLDTEPNQLQEGFRASLFQHTGGHPLFTVEVVRAMQARGNLLQDDGGRWIEGPALDWEALPARVEAVIEERLSRLDDDLREILMVASVEGEEFTTAALAEVLGTDEQQLVRTLSGELEKNHRLVKELGARTVAGHRVRRYRFRQALLQQYLYYRFGKQRRMSVGHL